MKHLTLFVLIIATASVCWGQNAQAGPDPRNANELTTFENTISAGSFMRMCQVPTGYDAGRCMGMIDGWVMAITDFHPKGLTIEPNVSRLQVVHVFLSFMAKHPEMENLQCYAALNASLTDAGLFVVTENPKTDKK